MKKRIKKITLKTVLLSALVVSILGLVVYNIRDLLFGAPLSVTIAPNGSTVADTFMPISGKALHAREILINGRAVLVDRKGRFSDSILLSPGYNIIEVALKDRFGNKKVKRYHLVAGSDSAVATNTFSLTSNN
jgi:hypothetical protein